MTAPERAGRLRRRALVVAAIAVVWLFFTIDDWSRDFVSHRAELSPLAENTELRPFESTLPVSVLAAAAQQAARRIRTWSYVGEVVDPPEMRLGFLRSGRLPPIDDEITVRIVDHGDRRTVTAESVSRVALPDLGRNPRNLARFRRELDAVLLGSVVGGR